MIKKNSNHDHFFLTFFFYVEGKKLDDDIEEKVLPLQNMIMQLSDGLHSIQGEEKYMRVREMVHRDSSYYTFWNCHNYLTF